MTPSARRGVACLAVTVVGWGLNWPAMKVVLRELPPLFARGVAGTAAGLVLLGVAAVLGHRLRVPAALFGRLAALAFTNVFAWMGFATLAMRWLDVSQGALLVYTMPIWATLFAWPLRGRRPGIGAIAGLVCCCAGLWTLLGAGDVTLGPGQGIGAALALASAVVFAYGTVAIAPADGVSPLTSQAWQLVAGCTPMIVLGIAFEQPSLARVDATGWLLMGYMTAVPMGACYLAWFEALRRLPPATAAIATLLTPVVGVVSAAITIGDPLGVRTLVALVLTIGGVALTLFGPPSR